MEEDLVYYTLELGEEFDSMSRLLVASGAKYKTYYTGDNVVIELLPEEEIKYLKEVSKL